MNRILPPWPDAWIEPNALYGRQDIWERTGIKDDVLSYWIKRGLLIPEGSMGGKGVHHRFHFSQINIAIILGVFRDNFGANIGTLSSLAAHLQRAILPFRDAPERLSLTDWALAARIASNLHSYRAGEVVLIRQHDAFSLADLQALPPEEQYARRPAVSELEVLEHAASSDALSPAVLRYTKTLGPTADEDFRIALVILGFLLDPSYMSDIYWIMRQEGESWIITERDDEGTRSGTSDIGPALFVPVVRIIGQAWGIPGSRERFLLKQAKRIQQRLRDAGISAKVFPHPENEETYIVDELDADWSIARRVIEAAGFRANVEEGTVE